MILVLIGGAGIALARQYDERTRMEAEAMAAAAAYRLLADNSTDMIVQTDMNAIQRFVSPASEAILGFRPEELVGQPTGPNIHKDDIDFIDRVKSEILAGAVEARAVYRCYKRDGRIIWLEANIRPFRNAAGALEGTVAVIRDISAQKMIEGELRLGQSRLRQALDAADLGTWEREGDNQYRLDSMAQKYFDVSEDIVEGDVLISRADPKDKDLIRARLAELQTGSESEYKFLVDAKYFDRSGNSRHLEISAHLAFAGTGTDRRQISGFGTVRDITERKAAEAVVSELAFRDPLTGLPNRRLLLDRLEHFRAAFERRLRWGALIFVDLDKFKLLNDTYGHHRGDQLLKQVALRIQTCVRESDTVSRFGGDEFVILAEDIGGSFEEAEAKARVIGEKILREFEAPFLLDDHDYKSTPSIGISVIGDQGLSVDELLGQADAAMYQAKAAGRNTMRFFKFS
jgi:diguanylate cyclase (GGDEF)-like protein/PAS domain S-box-containing protein